MSAGPTPYMPFKKYSPPPRPPFDYGRLIKGTLSLVWRHRFLWFFGLFAGGSVNSFGGWSGNFSGSFDSGGEDFSQTEAATEVGNWVSDHIALIVALVVAMVILGILAWLWSIVCRGAVIGATQDIREGAASGFSAAFHRGTGSFGRLLLFDLFLLMVGIGFMLIAVAVGAALVFLALSGEVGQAIVATLGVLVGLALIGLLIASLGFFACFTVWFVPWLLVAIIIMFATRAVVLDGARPVEALKRGWRLLMDNLARTLLLFLLGSGLSIVGSIGTVAAVVATAIPAIVAWVITGTGGWPTGGIIAASVLSVLPLAALILAAALVNTYFTSYWTIIYLKFTGRDREPEPAPAIPPYPPAPFPPPPA